MQQHSAIHRSRQRIWLLLVGVCLFLAACDNAAGSSTPAPKPTGTLTGTTTPPVTVVATTPTIGPPDTPASLTSLKPITIGIANDPVRLDPANVSDANSLMVSRQIYDTLYEFETGTTQASPSALLKFRYAGDIGKNGEQIVYSGECRDANNDATPDGASGLCFQLQLVLGAKFANGDPLDALAVAENFKRWKCLSSPNLGPLATALSYVDITQKPFGKKIIVHLNTPRATFESDLARPQYGIINPRVWAEPDFPVTPDSLRDPVQFAQGCPLENQPDFGTSSNLTTWKDAAGSGPYVVSAWKPRDSLTLVTNPMYLSKDEQQKQFGSIVNRDSSEPVYTERIPYTSPLYIKVLKANQTGVEEIAANHVQISPKMTANDMGNSLIAGSKGQVDIAQRPTLNVGILAMNIRRAPFDKVEVREAISLAINRTNLANSGMYHGLAIPIGLFQPPNSLFYDFLKDPSANNVPKLITPNLTQAHNLLVKVGYGTGLSLTLYLPPENSAYFPDAQKVFDSIHDDLKQIGINLEQGQALDRVEFDQRRDAPDDTNLGFYLYGYQGSSGDPDEFFRSFFSMGRDGQTTLEYGPVSKAGTIQNLIFAAAANTDDNKRKRNDYFTLNQLLSTQFLPYIPLVSANIPVAVRCEVHNYVPNPTGTESWNRLWLSTSCAS